MHQNPPAETLYRLLDEAKTIAIVGASSNPDRPSHGIMRMLQGAGYRVIPVNPNEEEILGEKCYGALSDIPGPVDIVNVFRRPAQTPMVAEEAVKIGAKALWLQLGIANEDAARIAEEGGLSVVMDSCIKVVHRQLGLPGK